MKSTIAIIGATGKMGSALARSFARAGYPLLLMGREQERLQQMAEDIRSIDCSSVEAVGCAKEAAWEADIIIPAVPYRVQAEVAGHIRPVAVGKIIISIANLSDHEMKLLAAASAAEELQNVLPHSKVIKAFNTTFAADFDCPRIAGITPDCFVAGDDAPSVEVVLQLVKDAGFNPLIAGDLHASRTLESMMLLLDGLSQRYGYRQHAGWKVLADQVTQRDKSNRISK